MISSTMMTLIYRVGIEMSIRSRWLMISVGLGILLNPLNSSMISVAIPRLQNVFHLDFTVVSWIIFRSTLRVLSLNRSWEKPAICSVGGGYFLADLLYPSLHHY